ncbi:MAG TPA: hypothetical protein VNZ03_14720 [Terriglobales bacterium]|nr:hypothetical protein [Terriglobales bacterium]
MSGECFQGSSPSALRLGSDGNFYDEAGSGGAFGYGTILKFTGEGSPITLHSFDGTDGPAIPHDG